MLTALVVRVQNWLGQETGQWSVGSGVGLFAFVVVILFVAWLMVRASIINIP